MQGLDQLTPEFVQDAWVGIAGQPRLRRDGDLVQNPRQRCGIDARVLACGIGQRLKRSTKSALFQPVLQAQGAHVNVGTLEASRESWRLNYSLVRGANRGIAIGPARPRVR